MLRNIFSQASVRVLLYCGSSLVTRVWNTPFVSFVTSLLLPATQSITMNYSIGHPRV